MAWITDPYVKKKLGETYKHGIAPCVVGVYQIVIGLVGLSGVLLIWIARQAMNRSIKPYLEAKMRIALKRVRGPVFIGRAEHHLESKKRIALKRVRGPVFIGRAEHPHRTRTTKELPEWRPIETPSTIQKRDGGR